MIDKTTNYKLFKFREDNRAAICQSHVEKLYQCIKSKNLLSMRPIIVNENYEVIDGQHRLLAAEKLGVEIYYKVEKSLDQKDIITLNISKAWGMHDFMNYYVKNGYEEYIKLQEFSKKNQLQLRIAYGLTTGSEKKGYSDFKMGKYKFTQDLYGDEIENCWRIIDYIKKMNGFSAYLNTYKFWSALTKMVRSENFDIDKFMLNLSRMVERFNAKATIDDYCRLFQDVNNRNNQHKIKLLDNYE